MGGLDERIKKLLHTCFIQTNRFFLNKHWYVFHHLPFSGISKKFPLNFFFNGLKYTFSWHGSSTHHHERLRSKSPITAAWPQERLAALEECHDLGQGFQLAERDMGIRGFGNIFGEQQTGDVGNVGIDLFFEMLFESLSKVFYFLLNLVFRTIISFSPIKKSPFIVYISFTAHNPTLFCSLSAISEPSPSI